MDRQFHEIEWPRWASIALGDILLTALVTLVATLNDIF